MSLCVSDVLNIWQVVVEFMKDRVKSKLLQKWIFFFFLSIKETVQGNIPSKRILVFWRFIFIHRIL